MEAEQKPLEGLEKPQKWMKLTNALILPASPCSASPKIITAVISSP